MTAVPLLLLLWMQEPCAGEGEVDCRISRGLESAVAAELETDTVRKNAFLGDAASDFQEALKLEPDMGAALNNLAQVLADLGRDAEAEPLFKRAIASEDPLRPFYRRNYGDFLASRGRWESAVDQYRAVLEEQPTDRQAHDSLVDLLSRHRPDAIPGYLRVLLDRRQVVWASEVALSRLREEPTEEYLSLLAEAQAGQATPPEQLLPREVVEVLEALARDRQVGEGARELLALNEGGDFDPAGYTWWAERPDPRRAFRSLARSFGDSQRQAGRVASAGSYYRLAVLLTREEPDLVSFRRMLDLPSATEDPETVNQLAVWNEQSLRKSRPERAEVYRYRHDLGLHYAALGRSGDCRCPTSGIYQLERAVQLGDVAGPPDGDPPFDARVYIRLAELYLGAGRPEAAAQALRSLAGAYSDQGMGAEAGIAGLAVPAEPAADTGSDLTRSTNGVSGDPLVPLRDFTTEPPRPPRP
jgi:tetratricopeptide (TPR) repeat protein